MKKITVALVVLVLLLVIALAAMYTETCRMATLNVQARAGWANDLMALAHMDAGEAAERSGVIDEGITFTVTDPPHVACHFKLLY